MGRIAGVLLLQLVRKLGCPLVFFCVTEGIECLPRVVTQVGVKEKVLRFA